MKLKEWLKSNKEFYSDTDLHFLIKDVFPQSNALIFAEESYMDSLKVERLNDITKAYLQGVPLAYILGKENFFGLDYKIDSRVLIPRKETELIVEKAIDTINKINGAGVCYVLDLCCGCGNIGISIKKAVSKAISIFLSDVSLDALSVASINRKIHNEDIKIVNADLLTSFKYKIFDLIISNPPYVETERVKGSLNYEPALALEAGRDGLNFINKILKQAHKYLKDNGYLVMEIGYEHKELVSEFVRASGLYEIAEWIKDYSGYWRGVVLKLKI